MPLLYLLLGGALAGLAAAAPPSLRHPAPQTDAEKTVYKGRQATPEQLRSIVTITFEDAKSRWENRCTGVLISRNVAATAAHCWWMTPNGKLLRVKAATVSLRAVQGARRTVVAGAPHERYDPATNDAQGNVYDIGFVVFKGALPDVAAPAELLADETGLTEGRETLYVGTGNMERGARPGPKAATLTVVGVEEGLIWTSGLIDTGICSGDSGGPLFLEEGGRRLLAGIASTSTQADCKKPGDAFFASVPRHRAWLLSAARAAQERMDAAPAAR